MSGYALLFALSEVHTARSTLAQCQISIVENILIIRIPDRVWGDFIEVCDVIHPHRLEVDAVQLWRSDQRLPLISIAYWF